MFQTRDMTHVPNTRHDSDGSRLDLTRAASLSNGAYSSATGQGLHATYYTTSTPTHHAFSRPIHTRAHALASLSAFSADVPSFQSSSAASAVFDGFLRLPLETPAELALEASVASTHERVKVWLDHTLLIDHWSSLSALTAAALLPAHARAGGQIVALRMEYQRAASKVSRISELPAFYVILCSTYTLTALIPRRQQMWGLS